MAGNAGKSQERTGANSARERGSGYSSEMASRVITQLISDLSGDEIQDGDGETIDFAYRGTSYTIDLTAKEAAEFDGAIALYLDNATKQSGTRRSSSPRSASGKGDAKAVREWAVAQGLDVPSRGRIPAEIRAQYEAAN